MKHKLMVLFACGLLLTACAPFALSPGDGTTVVGTAVAVTIVPDGSSDGTVIPLPTPQPPTFIASPPAVLSPSQLKYAVLEEFPDFFYCDPDDYPVAHGDEMPLALERFSEIQANTDEFRAILKYNGLAAQTNFTEDQKLLIYREHKKLTAILMEPAGSQYRFWIRTQSQDRMGHNITGVIDGEGNISIREVIPGTVDCPICLAAGTEIDTLDGLISVEDLQEGDLVWTVDTTGKRILAPILKVGSTYAPVGHRMIHLTLADGRKIWASPGHPATDGRALGDLVVGDFLNGIRVTGVERVPYSQEFTYDLLPAGRTGFYWANGILVGSTLID